MLKKLLCFLLAFFSAVLVSAKEPGYKVSTLDSCAAVAQFITFKSKSMTVNFQGLKITPIKPVTSSGLLDSSYDQPINKNIYWTSSGYTYVGVKGISISFKNETQSAAIISWRDSVVSVNGTSYGMPFIPGMAYRDAFNPSAVPNTVIPPGQSVVVSAFTPTISPHHWQNPIPMPREGSLVFSYYLNVTVNGNTSYITVDAPGAYLPPASETLIQKSK